jgi:hypothetical protein
MAKKGRPAMRVSPEAASTPVYAQTAPREGSRRPADLAYQAVTVAAILMVLASLWAF